MLKEYRSIKSKTKKRQDYKSMQNMRRQFDLYQENLKFSSKLNNVKSYFEHPHVHFHKKVTKKGLISERRRTMSKMKMKKKPENEVSRPWQLIANQNSILKNQKSKLLQYNRIFTHILDLREEKLRLQPPQKIFSMGKKKGNKFKKKLKKERRKLYIERQSAKYNDCNSIYSQK